MGHLSVWNDSFLARRTIERRASVLHDTPDRAAAPARRTFLALAVVDVKVMLEHPELAVGEPVIAQRGAAIPDGLIEHRLDTFDQALRALVRRARFGGDRRRDAFGRKPCAVERLADIDV